MALRKIALNTLFWFAEDHSTLAKTQPVLMTISFSHYCELARWCLDRKGVKYSEYPYLPICHAPLVYRARGKHGTKGRSTPLLLLPKKYYEENQTGTSLGLAVHATPDDNVRAIDSSFDIMKWTGHTIDPAWESLLHDKVAPAVRRLVYAMTLNKPELVTLTMSNGTFAERSAWWLLRNNLVAMMVSAMQIKNETYLPPWYAKENVGTEVSLNDVVPEASSDNGAATHPTYTTDMEVLKEAFAIANSKLSQQTFLSGAAVNGDDIAFASLVGAIFCLPNYGGPIRERCLSLSWNDLEADFRAEMQPLRESPAGLLIDRLYDEHRLSGIVSK